MMATTRADIEAAIADGTIFRKLMNECQMTPTDAGEGKISIEIEMPDWFSMLEAESQRLILRTIRSYSNQLGRP